ncbi:hypothetical protein RUM8411_04135 [Ruegeria meonggei]|uniref:Uncharacterized protein n=1 Tax=Ruegeria meonggei TaxID=1446476 RepID=A0A1X7ABW7_9RHOB|nr:hypothetical protein RUM8411_04135 [Ruegeria meonggei]
MSFKSSGFLSLLAAFFGKTFGACVRMQRQVNRLHTSLTKGSVKRPELDS